MMVVVFDDDKVFLRDHEVLAVDFAKNLGPEDVGRRARGIKPGF
jgi:hypothetical protein